MRALRSRSQPNRSLSTHTDSGKFFAPECELCELACLELACLACRACRCEQRGWCLLVLKLGTEVQNLGLLHEARVLQVGMLDRIDMRRASSVPELKHTPLSSMATDQFLGHAYHAYHAYLPICLFAYLPLAYLYICIFNPQ